ncbi:MAG: alpha/beta hydrolase [SAR202 cluster bacterium]|nr:alpha/beta hydrolase [SAR202 cluster bacterium]
MARAWPLLRSIATGVLLSALVVLMGSLIAGQTGMLDRHYIFFPSKDILETPADYGLAFEDVTLEAADGTRLHGWFIPGGPGTTWVWFHGNGGNVAGRLDELAAFHRMLDASIFIFDYRGYGRSEGTPSEAGLYLDAEAALAYLRSRNGVDASRIVLYGRSLGSAVAVEMAAKHDVAGVALEAPFTSIKAMARKSYPFIPAWLLVKSRFDTLSKMPDVKAPLLVLHSDMDELIPIDMGRQVYDAAGGPKRFVVLEGAAHNDPHPEGDAVFFSAMREFLNSLENE